MSSPLPEAGSKTGSIVTALAGVLILLRLAVLNLKGPLWGLSALSYLGPGPALIWTFAGLVALLPFLFRRSVEPRWAAAGRALPAGAVAAAFLLLTLFFPNVATPLLGDGIDRLEATLAGFQSLVGQPAPLDLALHTIAYKAYALAAGDSFASAWKLWRLLSYLAGAAGAAALWKLAGLGAENRGGRVFLFFVPFFAGTVIFFFGYVENYVLLAAGLYGFYLLFTLAARRAVPLYTLLPALAALVGLHYFMALIAPAVLYALARHGLWRPSRRFGAAALILALAFSALALTVINDYYGGLAAIFVAPGQWLGGYHLLGFLNQQLLASPALLLLLPLVLAGRRRAPAARDSAPGFDPLRTLLGAAALILLVFFFFLRPVIGPGPDWDLFALPALAYTPWLVLTIYRDWRGRPDFARVGWAVMVLTAVLTGPWLSVNMTEPLSFARYRGLLEWEAGHNPWAASYGYLRLGKYLSRRSFDRRNPEIAGSLLRAVRINPDSATLRKQVAQAFSALGDEAQARPQLAAHHRLLGAYDERNGRFSEAASQYEQSLGYEPADQSVIRALVAIYQTKLGDPARATAWRQQLAPPPPAPPPLPMPPP
jgi:hypothetical protein